jgi:hypothetical protein
VRSADHEDPHHAVSCSLLIFPNTLLTALFPYIVTISPSVLTSRHRQEAVISHLISISPGLPGPP